MHLPVFFIPSFENTSPLMLDEDTSRHIVSVLRMKTGEHLCLTDGKGNLLTATISDDHKKRCMVVIDDAKFLPKEGPSITLAVSLLKNANRFEWFLEKATELGISRIQPLLCERTGRQHFREDRMRNILVSAMLQSQQCWLPEFPEPAPFRQVVEQSAAGHKYIAHCAPGEKTALADAVNGTLDSRILLIGPEGDFSTEEIELAELHQFKPVTLGDTRLRTETAAVVGATLLKLKG